MPGEPTCRVPHQCTSVYMWSDRVLASAHRSCSQHACMHSMLTAHSERTCRLPHQRNGVYTPCLLICVQRVLKPFETQIWGFVVRDCWGAQDLPDGNYAELKKRGLKEKAKGWYEYMLAIRNYRTFVCMAMYGFCFGVEVRFFSASSLDRIS